jgi:hypothetical protein
MNTKEPSVTERFTEIDAAALRELGSEVVDQIMVDIQGRVLSIKQIADKNGVRCADVAQVCRFHSIDINGNTLTH